VRGLSLPRDFGARFTARAVARVSRSIECDAVVYLSSFENHPNAVATLAAGRALWGNPPDVLRRVRDPLLLAAALRDRGFAAPAIPSFGSLASPKPSGEGGLAAPKPLGEGGWLVKPLQSGGGHRVRPWRRGARVPRRCYLQEYIDGLPASVVFVAAGGRAVPLGVSCQLVGEPAFGASGYRYCGNVLVSAGDPHLGNDVVDAVCELARHVSEEFRLVGVNGIDFIARDGIPYAIEVNPRWSSSMELVERAYGVSVFGAHAAACANGALPTFDLARARRSGRASGKAVVFARTDVIAGDTRPWLEDATVRDVPVPGERISAGQPVCTVFAEQVSAAACHAALARRAEAVYEAIATWQHGGRRLQVTLEQKRATT